MKNITVSVDDETYRRARIAAAEREISVSALVRDLLRSLDTQESRFERLKRQERALLDSIHGFNAADRLSRDEVHDRKA